MSEQNYQIVMHTPLGLRYGSMCCRITGGNMEGTISLMGYTALSRHDCRRRSLLIEGKIATLMRPISYCGSGKITGDTLRLSIQGERRSYNINGSLCGLEEKL
ncbi:MAG: hypothetical protein ACLU9S_12465 [Oscillospiraceae bacterium]